jgi:hypothetical protein
MQQKPVLSGIGVGPQPGDGALLGVIEESGIAHAQHPGAGGHAGQGRRLMAAEQQGGRDGLVLEKAISAMHLRAARTSQRHAALRLGAEASEHALQPAAQTRIAKIYRAGFLLNP